MFRFRHQLSFTVGLPQMLLCVGLLYSFSGAVQAQSNEGEFIVRP